MHETTKLNIEKMNEKYHITASKGRKEVKLEPCELVWLHLRKERFPELRKSKLMSRAAGPFKILGKINDNASKLSCLPELVSHLTFQICDLTWEKKMRCHQERRQCKRGRTMRTSILRLQSFLPLRYLALSHNHKHNN
jgi:hypothetical protein